MEGDDSVWAAALIRTHPITPRRRWKAIMSGRDDTDFFYENPSGAVAITIGRPDDYNAIQGPICKELVPWRGCSNLGGIQR